MPFRIVCFMQRKQVLLFIHSSFFIQAFWMPTRILCGFVFAFMDLRKLFWENDEDVDLDINSITPGDSSKERKDISNGSLLKSAHFITVKSPNHFPNVINFLKTLLQNTDIQIKHVGKAFPHSHLKSGRDCSLYGTFMSYFIRKHLSNQLNVALVDFHTEQILKQPENYYCSTEPDIDKDIKKHYKIYKSDKTQAMEIIECIKTVSLSELIHYRHPLFKKEYYVDEANLWEVVKYFRRLPYRSVDLNAKLNCEYFYANADLLFDDEVIYDIRLSRLESLSRDHKTINISQFYKMILFAFGFSKKTGKVLKTFKIYNPLLGYEYSIKLNDIDFSLFEKVLKKDTDRYCFLKEFKNVNVYLDIGSVPSNKCIPAAAKEPQSNAVCKAAQLNTDRIRKSEGISGEETALLNINRGKKMIKRRVKNPNTFF